MTSSLTIPATESSPNGPLLSRPRYATELRESAYSIAVFPIGIAAFTVAVTMLSVGAGLLITLVGLPILTLAAYTARGFAFADRRMLTTLVGQDAPAPRYRADHDPRLLGRLLIPLRDPQTWLDLAFSIIRMPLGIVSFTVTVVWWSITLGGLTWPLYGWALPSGPDNQDLSELLGLSGHYFVGVIFYVIIGLVGLLTLPWAIRIATWVHAGPALLMLSGRASMQDELERVQVGRVAARDAQATELRRLERDIHDGPQQRLVRLSMDLGRLRNQLAPTPNRLAASWTARSARPATLSTSCALFPVASRHQSWSTAAWKRQSRKSPPGRTFRSPLSCWCLKTSPRTWRQRPTSWSPKR